MGGIRLGGVEYTREQVKGFYEWQMLACLKHFPDEKDSEDKAKAFAFSRPNANGFITFQTKYRGKRFYWIREWRGRRTRAYRLLFEDLTKRKTNIKSPLCRSRTKELFMNIF